MFDDHPHSIPWWADHLQVAPNTLHNWVKNKDLPADARSGRSLLSAGELRDWLIKNPQLHAANRALDALEAAARFRERQGDTGVRSIPLDADIRDQLRQLRAQVATLDDQLHAERRTTARLRRERDEWRSRARAHRASLRSQLDLEEQADSVY